MQLLNRCISLGPQTLLSLSPCLSSKAPFELTLHRSIFKQDTIDILLCTAEFGFGFIELLGEEVCALLSACVSLSISLGLGFKLANTFEKGANMLCIPNGMMMFMMKDNE